MLAPAAAGAMRAGPMRCTRCGSENREGRKFCAGCGAELGWSCAACGFANEAAEAFCGGCGSARAAPTPTPTPAKPATGGSEALGERRQVAILFADLCGFTSLSARLDAEDLRRVVEEFYAKAGAAISRAGGSVDKHIGDAVMALFGAPVAHGDDALRALRAALDITASAAEIAEPGGGPLAAHVGVAMGEVVAGGIGHGYTVLGDAVNLASRLVGLAGPGEVVIDGELRRRLEGQVRALQLPPAQLKGIQAPVVAWRLEALEAARRPESPYIGRETDRRMLGGLLDACRTSGRGRVIVLRGEAGIGKSRLIEETMGVARGLGFASHKALVLDFGAGKGLDARGMLVRSVLGLSPDSGEEARRVAMDKAERGGLLQADERAILLDLLDLPAGGEDRALIQAMDERTRQARRRALLVVLLTRLAQERPLFVAIEDLHWADELLLEDLAALGAATVETAILLALSTRPEGDPLDRAWRTRLGPAPVSTIDLAPLSPAESARLAEAHLKGGDPRTAACIERAGGNPFFLEQLLRHSGEVASAAVPASVQSLVLGRADLLPAAEKRALQAASVLGQRMALEALGHLLHDQRYDAGRLVDQQFMRREGSELAFVHALVRDGIYGSLLKARRRELHLAAAAWYGERDLALRAQHLDLAGSEEAAPAYLAAAEAAGAAYRVADALELASRGAALAADAASRVTLASLRAELLQALGRTGEAVAALEQVEKEAAPGPARLRVWLGLAQGLSVLDRFEEAAALLERAEPEAKEQGLTPQLSAIHTLRGNMHFPRGRIEECLAEHSEALRLAEAAGAAEEQARALGGLADAYYMRGRYRTACRAFERCVEISAASGFRRIEAANRPMLGMMMMMDLRLAEALDQAKRAEELAERIGHRRAAMIASHGLAFLGYELDRPALAQRAGMSGLDIARSLGARRFIAECLMLQALGEFRAGEAKARTTIAEANEIASETPAYLLPFGLGLAALMATGAEERAAALAAGEAVLAAGAVWHNHLFFNRYAIEASLAAGDWDGAARYADALERSMAEEPYPIGEFLVARARAVAAAGRGRKDEARLRQLIAQAEAAAWPVVLPALERALES